MILNFFSHLILTTALLQMFPVDAADVQRSAFRPSLASASMYDAFSIPSARLPLSKEAAPKKMKPESLGVVSSAASAIVVDRRSKQILFQKNVDAPRSIGSITKLMTAHLFLKSSPNMDATATLESRDLRAGGIQHIWLQDELTLKDLFYASLMSSDNSATMALVRLSGKTEADFVTAMNEEAKFLGMTRTVFFDPTGLSPKNESVVSDIVRLLDVIAEEPLIREVTQQSFSIVTTRAGKIITLKSTDELLQSMIHTAPYRIVAGKTGYLPEAGYCLGTVVSREGAGDILVVVLGSDTNEQRFHDVKSLAVWAYQTFSWNL